MDNKTCHFFSVKKHWEEVSIDKYQSKLETKQQNKKYGKKLLEQRELFTISTG